MRACLRSLATFCVGIGQAARQSLEALEADEIHRAAQAAALHIPRWSRAHLAEATVLLLCRREDLAAQWPDELGSSLSHLNDDLAAAMRRFTKRRYGRITSKDSQTVVFALVDVPYAAVRRYLIAGQPPPPAVDDLVTAACDAALFA